MYFKGQRKRKIELMFDQVPQLRQLRVWIIYAWVEIVKSNGLFAGCYMYSRLGDRNIEPEG